MKTAIVTAASRGIGLAVAKMLAAKGYRIIGTYAHNHEAARHAEELLGNDSVLLQINHAERTQTYRFAEEVGKLTSRVDCIICNAGITVRHSFTETTDEEWDSMMEVGLNAHIILLRKLFPLIQPHSRIIFTGSAMGCYPHATVLGYGVVKGAIHAAVKNLVKVFEPLQTTVNAVAPGFVDTEWQLNKPAEVRENICRKTAIHRFATVEETAAAYAFCIDNEFVNGSIINVDGGYNYQ